MLIHNVGPILPILFCPNDAKSLKFILKPRVTLLLNNYVWLQRVQNYDALI